MSSGPANRLLLEMRGISKRYGNVQANRRIDLMVPEGRIVGLLGENGSGKSTLMKVLFGMVRADGGTITIRGRPLASHSPREALAAGIGMIHQHFMLVDAMSVAENVMLGWRPAGRWLRRDAVAKSIISTSRRYGLDVHPDELVKDLPFGRRQRVEIIKTILRGAELLILDEPTSNLSPPEVSGLLDALRRLRDEGRSVIFISHKLGEVLEVCDDVVVLRGGEVVGTCAAREATRPALARLMVGQDLATPKRAEANPAGPGVFEVSRLSLRDHTGVDKLREISFTIHAGEIFAVAGVDGNGQSDLVDVLAGTKRATRGRIVLQGRDISSLGAGARVAAGIGYIPVDRGTTGLVPGMTIAENLGLRDFSRPPLRRGPWLNRSAFHEQARQRIQAFAIRCAGPDATVQTLSGGNQQKVVLARELGRRPKVLLAFQPTWGLDPGATHYVVEQILALRAAGAAILYISS
ncbi:MAG: ABC transporter ATP-binding protein, partial [Verrucomicrobia bacterium]|nr:ABC transporter ATP-binding protein [Verrucomicrobiota bacterium]